MSPNPRPARRSDVARAAGVAPTTVSLVLNRNPGTRIPETTRRRVEEAAKRLGYRSNSHARALVSGRAGAVGAVLHFAGRPFRDYVAGVLDGFWSPMADAGLRVLVANGSGANCAAGLFRERSVDGMMVMIPPTDAVDPELTDLLAAGFPAVFIGARPGLPGGDYADIDNRATARDATRRLIAAGHRDILHLAGPLAVNTAAVDRRDGHREALAEAGIPWRPELCLDCSFSPLVTTQRLAAFLDAGGRCTAIAAASHAMAKAAARLLLARGLRVPEQVSLVAIDAMPTEPDLPCAITAYAQPLPAIGRAAAELLLARIAGDRSPPRRVLLPCPPPAGGSIAPPPS